VHRVAITGIGIISVLGLDTESVADSLFSGRSGIAIDPERVERGFRSPLAGRIDGFSEKKYLNRKQRKTMPDYCIQAYAAVEQAIMRSGLAPEDLQNDETGLIFGNDSSCIAAIEQVDLVRQHNETASIGSGFVFKSMTSNITMNLNTILGTRGACYSISSACSSGGHALGQSADLIRFGRQERMICGGAQELNWESMCSFDALEAFSTRLDAPDKASRPFDRDRDGLVPSGGAAAVLLERYDIAQARGATILGELKSYAFSSDGLSISVPSKDGISRAMSKALTLAELTPADIDYVCAHATSTPAGDAAEAQNISAVFGDLQPRVSSLKSMTGHELWMSGAAQVVYSTIMAQKGFIAPNLNFRNPDEHSAALNIVTETVQTPPKRAICNSAGFGGTNSCLVLDFTV
jgi:3-oxoacyl-[acyl-carrier-protein] synthase-1